MYRKRLHRIGPSDFVHETITSKSITAKKLLTAFGIRPPLEWNGYRPDVGYYRLLGLAISRELSIRKKLPEFNTIDDAIRLFRDARNIMVITGAGVRLPRASHTAARALISIAIDFNQSGYSRLPLKGYGFLCADGGQRILRTARDL